MELKNLADVDACMAIKNADRIRNIERKMDRLDYVPAIIFIIMLVYGGVLQFTDTSNNWHGSLLVLGSVVLSIGSASMQKTEYLKQLFELKYGK